MLQVSPTVITLANTVCVVIDMLQVFPVVITLTNTVSVVRSVTGIPYSYHRNKYCACCH